MTTDSERTTKPATEGIITMQGDGRPHFSMIEFSGVVLVFVFVTVALLVLFFYPRDWKADDAKNKEKTMALMKELYAAMIQYSTDFNGGKFPPEIDNFLHHSPLEWRRLGVCPASNKRFSIQIIPGWTLEDIKKHPTELLAYDYNEDELRYKDLDYKKVIDEAKTKAEGKIEERPLNREEKWAILANRIEDVPPANYKNSNQLYSVRSALLREATLGRNFSDGYVVMTLDGTVKFVPDVEFCRYRMRIFHRELVKQAENNERRFPKDVASAVINMFADETTWWLKNSLAICPGDTSLIGFDMPQEVLTLDDPGTRILLYTSKPELFKGRNVLFIDGTVKFMTESEFRKKLVEEASNNEAE